MKEGVRLFDFNNTQIRESYMDTEDKSDPLEDPKIYLNVVYHD